MVDVAHARVVAVLTRAPSSGGKSRLFAELGRPPDARLLEALLLDTLDGVAAPGVRVVVAVTPPSACEEIRELVRAGRPDGSVHDVIPQADGDLGERMRATMAWVFAHGARAVALTGSDLPHIAPSLIAAAFEALEREPDALVLGPSADGGYYLVGSTRLLDVFGGIEWGGADVLAQTRRVAAARAVRVHVLDVLADVDHADDLRRAARGGRAPRTAAWLREHP
ncbi:MAG: TIGR04282 family arsenosugar biosynthesis glycosyltransferase [Acidobacteria bacterium]|nr:TIGR04282 family arsenosugar biosynthesis glycosyltransferase [Acidobacteriota bacterium]